MPEAPRIGSAVYQDEYIEYWADRFVEGGFCYRGVTLLQFLAMPQLYVNEHRPLLPHQRRVRTRVINAELRAMSGPQRDGEPLDLAWSAQR